MIVGIEYLHLVNGDISKVKDENLHMARPARIAGMDGYEYRHAVFAVQAESLHPTRSPGYFDGGPVVHPRKSAANPIEKGVEFRIQCPGT